MQGVIYIIPIDFIMSIPGERFLMLFQAFVDIGVWILFGCGVIWAGVSYNRPSKGKLWPQIVFAVGLIAFIWGVLITVYATGSVPRVLIGWGSTQPICAATVDAHRLKSFRAQYDLAVVCGATDPSVDPLTTQKITISSRYTIIPNLIAVEKKFSDDMAQVAQPGQTLTIWYKAILIPKNVELSAIHSLADVNKYGGKILESGLYE